MLPTFGMGATVGVVAGHAYGAFTPEWFLGFGTFAAFFLWYLLAED